MVTVTKFKSIALAFPGVTEQPHFEKTSFRTRKKIFATFSLEPQRATVKLSPIDQSVFCAFDKNIIYPVDSKWARQGWTHVELKTVKKNMLKDLLKCAYEEVSKH
jgi:hypothetical protein